MKGFAYRKGDRTNGISDVIPGLTTGRAHRFLHVMDEPLTLEGLCFDRKGDLYFTSTAGYTVYKINMESETLSVIFHEEGIRPAAVKIHRDGRLFVCCLTNEELGGVLVMQPDGSKTHWLLRGYSVDDLVFDRDGGFYFTNFIGDFRMPSGGVYHVSPDGKRITEFCGHMCQPNGIALSTDGTILWVTEFQANRLHRFDLKNNRAGIPYYFIGGNGPDSCSVDADDNLYVALPGQGRTLIFNPYGTPIGQVLTEGMEDGHNLFVTHPMVHPNHNELYLTVKDTAPVSFGSAIFRGPAYVPGNPEAFQFRR